MAVSEAGGLGLIGAWPAKGPDWLREQLRSVQERTQQPFGVGFISSAPHLDELVQAPFLYSILDSGFYAVKMGIGDIDKQGFEEIASTDIGVEKF